MRTERAEVETERADVRTTHAQRDARRLTEAEGVRKAARVGKRG